MGNYKEEFETLIRRYEKKEIDTDTFVDEYNKLIEKESNDMRRSDGDIRDREFI